MEGLSRGMTFFDDFLDLAAFDARRFRMIVFHGRSGSGKSTAIEFLRTRMTSPVVVVDEVTTLSDFVRVLKTLRNNAPVLVATHISPLWFRLIRPWSIAVFHTDRETTKITRHLNRRGIHSSQDAVAAYAARFRATYTDADLILERWPSASFDESLARFQKLDHIEA
jgi:hypothetical protein